MPDPNEITANLDLFKTPVQAGSGQQQEKEQEDWYAQLETLLETTKPKYDTASEERLRRLSKANAYGEGFRAIGDMVTAATKGNVERRQPSQIQPFVFKGLQDLNTDYTTRRDAYTNTVAGLRMKKQAQDDANKKWDEQLGIYKGNQDMQLQKQKDMNEYNAARVSMQQAKAEQDKAWKDYLKTKDAKALQLAYARLNNDNERLKLAKMKLAADPTMSPYLQDDDFYIGYDPLEAPEIPEDIRGTDAEIGYSMQYLTTLGLSPEQYQREAINMLTNQYNLSVPDAAKVTEQFITK